MKTLTAVLFVSISLLLGACSATPGKIETHHGVVYSSEVPIAIFQGQDETGIPLGVVHNHSTLTVSVSAGFEMFTAEFADGRGGEGTVTTVLVAGRKYFFTISQKAGTISPDVVITLTSYTQISSSTPVVEFSYSDIQAETTINAEAAHMNAIQKRLGCTDIEMRQGVCQ